MLKNLSFIFLLFVCLVQAKAQYVQDTLSETAKISLITNSSSDEEVYSLFGHTAIRVYDPQNGVDWVYNYGIFDFDTPNFAARFVKGETDYMLATNNFSNYLRSYGKRGVGVREQVLNLTVVEKQKIFEALELNALPENRVYRYNFFYDNCSTRPRDIIAENIDGKIEFIPTNTSQTFRDLVWESTHTQAWTTFGIDLVIGAGADKVISDREKDFLPKYLYNALDGAKIKNTSGEKLLVLERNELLKQTTELKQTPNYPMVISCILLAFTLLISYLSYKNKKTTLGKIFDSFLFFIVGFVGLVIFYLTFFSVHPCVDNNWNLAWAHPLQLIVALLFFVKPIQKVINYYHILNSIVLVAFLLIWYFVPQQLQLAFIPIILSLLIRSVVNILQTKRSNLV